LYHGWMIGQTSIKQEFSTQIHACKQCTFITEVKLDWREGYQWEEVTIFSEFRSRHLDVQEDGCTMLLYGTTLTDNI
jgi:hypothetical protein